MRLLRGAAVGLIVAHLVWPEHVQAQNGLGFRFVFGRQAMTGDLGAEFDPSIDSEFAVLIPVWALRIGGGASYASFRESGADSSWSQIGMHILVTYPLRLTPTLRPYVEARFTFRRLRPEDDRYFGGERMRRAVHVTDQTGVGIDKGALFEMAGRNLSDGQPLLYRVFCIAWKVGKRILAGAEPV